LYDIHNYIYLISENSLDADIQFYIFFLPNKPIIKRI
jgi:hypothetical protein